LLKRGEARDCVRRNAHEGISEGGTDPITPSCPMSIR
jgi:hypothetical protein